MFECGKDCKVLGIITTRSYVPLTGTLNFSTQVLKIEREFSPQ
jgi:hypothetical protein